MIGSCVIASIFCPELRVNGTESNFDTLDGALKIIYLQI